MITLLTLAATLEIMLLIWLCYIEVGKNVNTNKYGFYILIRINEYNNRLSNINTYTMNGISHNMYQFWICLLTSVRRNTILMVS